jgi:hypothetical protein
MERKSEFDFSPVAWGKKFESIDALRAQIDLDYGAPFGTSKDQLFRRNLEMQ